MMQHSSQDKLRQENQLLKHLMSQLTEAATENMRLSDLVAQANSAGSLREDPLRDLLRLRSEVTLLRGQSNYLDRLQQENRALRPLAHAKLVADEAKPQPAEEEARLACINNLRVLDNAIRTCAVENRIAEGNTIAFEQVASYLPEVGAPNGMPRCPSGGTYRISRVGEKPTCTVPGHGLKYN